MLKQRWIAGLLAGLFLSAAASGCAVHQRAKMAERAPSELVGMSKVELLSCAGVPVRSEKIENMEFLTYTGSGNDKGFFHRRHHYCEVTFTLKDGMVQKVSYAGNTGGFFTRGEQCAYVIAPCLIEEE
jgi:hypothetical protein